MYKFMVILPDKCYIIFEKHYIIHIFIRNAGEVREGYFAFILSVSDR